jgi:hypothetical protein
MYTISTLSETEVEIIKFLTNIISYKSGHTIYNETHYGL